MEAGNIRGSYVVKEPKERSEAVMCKMKGVETLELSFLKVRLKSLTLFARGVVDTESQSSLR